MNISAVAELFSSIDKTTKRLEMQALLADFYARSDPQEAAIVSYLLIGRIVPDFIPVEFQISDKTLISVVEKLLGREIKEDLTKLGDIGSVWEVNAPNNGDELSIPEYYKLLWESQTQKELAHNLQNRSLLPQF